MPRRERKLRFNRARRHFIGVAAAAGARIAAIGAFTGTMVSASAAKEKDKGQGQAAKVVRVLCVCSAGLRS